MRTWFRENIIVDRFKFESEIDFRKSTIERVRNIAKTHGPRIVTVWGQTGKNKKTRIKLMEVINHTSGPWPGKTSKYESPLDKTPDDSRQIELF